VSDQRDDSSMSDLRNALRKDSARHARREPGSRTFWRSLGILGMVGWPIALASVGGILIGRALDSHWQTGPQFTLLFLLIGVVIGCYVAWTTLSRKNGSAGRHR
jgi:ATP synthase protein I